MTFAQQFFEGLDGPASLTFMGLLFAAFLIGGLPAGLAYAFRVRDTKKRLRKHMDALEATLAERDQLRAQFAEQVTERVPALQKANEDLQQRLRQITADRQRISAELTRALADKEALAGENIATRVEAKQNDDYVQTLRERLATLSAQVQSLRAQDRPRPAPPAGAFDVDTLASLRAAKTRAAELESRLNQVMADNEKLRRRPAA